MGSVCWGEERNLRHSSASRSEEENRKYIEGGTGKKMSTFIRVHIAIYDTIEGRYLGTEREKNHQRD